MTTKKPEGRPVKYGPKEIKWILHNVRKKTTAEMATRFSITKGSMRHLISKLRTKGHEIPHGEKGAVIVHQPGAIVSRHDKNLTRDRKYIKLDNGKWKEILKGRPKGRPKTTGAGKKNKYTRKIKAASKLFVTPAVIKQKALIREVATKVRIPLPGGSFVVCDEDKVEATVRYLLRKVS